MFWELVPSERTFPIENLKIFTNYTSYYFYIKRDFMFPWGSLGEISVTRLSCAEKIYFIGSLRQTQPLRGSNESDRLHDFKTTPLSSSFKKSAWMRKTAIHGRKFLLWVLFDPEAISVRKIHFLNFIKSSFYFVRP